eukprot:1055733-Prorocentrum_minimum.AAC.1
MAFWQCAALVQMPLPKPQGFGRGHLNEGNSLLQRHVTGKYRQAGQSGLCIITMQVAVLRLQERTLHQA